MFATTRIDVRVKMLEDALVFRGFDARDVEGEVNHPYLSGATGHVKTVRPRTELSASPGPPIRVHLRPVVSPP